MAVYCGAIRDRERSASRLFLDFKWLERDNRKVARVQGKAAAKEGWDGHVVG
jgi:hypothetical protein